MTVQDNKIPLDSQNIGVELQTVKMFLEDKTGEHDSLWDRNDLQGRALHCWIPKKKITKETH